MNIQVQGRHLVVSDVLRQHAELVLQRLGRQFPAIRHGHITLTLGRQEHQVDIRVWAEGLDLRSEAHGEDLYAALSRAAGKLERRLQKGNDRNYRFGNHHGQHATLRCPDQRPLARLRPET
ncbi:ribosome hibernation-promoting factor, HPF/YfiA family [Armatimonas rosea]|uniref:Ribosomal subunit interface protein n=1 Tax=Armatimonas rosea TaxID=685828 RepID=A0A7W9W620_ARMRO|nr:ribosome-associated translation inhibitor RaiA [Armatimonas rosea]MBB6049127.1 ribosomal subunit interface protein [Armatimonas rosea]